MMILMILMMFMITNDDIDGHDRTKSSRLLHTSLIPDDDYDDFDDVHDDFDDVHEEMIKMGMTKKVR